MSSLEDIILQLQRRGETEKAKWLETIDQRIPPSFKERIKQNDKSVLNELVLPKWLTWDMLRMWALEEEEEAICSACGKRTNKYVVYKNLIICDRCLEEIKRLEVEEK